MPKKLTKSEFVEKARKVHGDKYDYSKVEYINNSTKVCIICSKHGEFWQKPNSHLNGNGCPKCKGEKLSTLNKKSTKQFIEDAIRVHGNKYDYSKVEYIDAHTKVCIICPTHGEFYQTPSMHLSGQGCAKCSIDYNTENNKLTKEEFIEKARKVHDDKYDYSKVEYINSKTKICIICPIHGEFYQTPNSHLSNHGCPKCKIDNYKEKQFITFKEFLNRANAVHKNKYNYSLAIDLKGLKTKIKIICPTHGIFEQMASDHIHGHGCPKCNCLHKTTEQFIEEANKVHDNLYSYEKTKYVNKLSKVIITCPIHGDFEQIPANHLNGTNCPKCAFSKLEKKVEKVLNNEKIEYYCQKKFQWLGKQTLDFYLPEYNVAIECQGVQHFKPVVRFGGENGFEKCFENDIKKYNLCKENNVKLLYYTELPQYFTFLGERLIKNEEELLKIITEKEK